MSYMDLLERMQSRDPEAFLEMTDRYGWAVYSTIRQKCSDRSVADRIYEETMNSFYHQLSRSTTGDPLEALLCAFADRVTPDDSDFSGAANPFRDTPPQIQMNPQELPCQRGSANSGGKRFWTVAVILLLLIILLALLWITAGVMMAMDYIPFYDLGYSWFNANILNFF